MVGRLTLDQEVGVRIPAPQPQESSLPAARMPDARLRLMLRAGWLLDALYDEDVVRRARLLRHIFAEYDAPRAGTVGQIELLAFHGLFVGDVIDVLPQDHRAI